MVLPADAATGRSLRVAFIRGTDLWVLDLTTHAKQIVMTRPGAGPVHWSGDGELLSTGGKIVGGPSLPTGELVWAPRGEIAAGITSQGGVFVWTPQGTTQLEPDGWGSTSVAWSDTGRLAIGRTIYGPPHNQEIWVWDGGIAPPTLAFGTGVEEPYPAAWLGNEVVWWDYPNSASLASDGVRALRRPEEDRDDLDVPRLRDALRHEAGVRRRWRPLRHPRETHRPCGP
jgi:hypothetical protein